MNKKRLPWIPTLLFCLCLRDERHEAMLGDLIEEFRRRQTPLWYWKQILEVFVRAALAPRGVVLGFTGGMFCAALSAVLNVLRGDHHFTSYWVTALEPSVWGGLIYLVVRQWQTSGIGVAEIRKSVRCSALTASVVMGVVHTIFVVWWTSAPRSRLVALFLFLGGLGTVMTYVVAFVCARLALAVPSSSDGLNQKKAGGE